MNKKKYLKLFLDFYKFTLIGIIASILNIFFVWLLVDIIGWKIAVASSLVVGIIFFFKFYSYHLIGLIKKQFLKYSIIQLICAVANVFLTWLLVDIFLLKTIIGTSLAVIIIFIARFLLFKVLKLIKE